MDTGTPTAIFKRSKTRAIRARELSPTGNASDETPMPSASPSTLAAKLKKQHKERAKPKARLSFGGDEEEGNGETFQVKKSSLSRKLKLGSSVPSGIALPSDLDGAPVAAHSSGVVYSKEYLSELKANTQSVPSPTRLPNNDITSAMILDASEMDGAVIVNEEVTEEVANEIPSESSIQMAKHRRERLRQAKTPNESDSDYIALSVSRKEDMYQGPHPESRLMREDDDLGEGDDEFAEYTAAQERMALGKKAKKKEVASRRAEMKELINDAEEEDEETLEWEKEQLRRGARRDAGAVDAPQAKQEYKPAHIPPATPLPSLEAAISRLSSSLTQLTNSHSLHTTAMSNLADERLLLEGREKEMRKMVEKAETKCTWFSSFREWVETVATFLDEKYPRLEELEEEHLSLLKERSEMTSKRRVQDDEDDLDIFLGSLHTETNGLSVEIGDPGRTNPLRSSAAARKERRRARSTRHLRHAHLQEEEGYSTDSSLPPSDDADYQTAMSNLHTKVDSVLEDVRSEEFQDPRKGVARWFGAWRDNYADTYSGAFGGLGMVSAWEFWVRLEMLSWDPISDPRALDRFSWFNALFNYSRPPQNSIDSDEEHDEEPQLGSDGDLASAMLSTIVPRLCKLIQGGAFDPYSAKHVRAVIDLTEQVEASASQEKIELLRKSVFSIFRQAVENDAVTVVPYLERDTTAKFDPESIPARRRFLTRRYKLLTNITRWRRFAGERFGASEMITRLITDCIHPIARTGWDVGGEELMQKVLSILPPELRNETFLET